MTKKPYMPLFPDAYISNTALLTLEEQGAYFRLLCHMWINGGKIENNDRQIVKMLNIHLNKWNKLRPAVLKYLTQCEPCHLTQHRLQKEYHRTHKSSPDAIGNTPGMESDNALKNHQGDGDATGKKFSPEPLSMVTDSGAAATGHPNPSPIPNIKDKDKMGLVNSCGQLLDPLLPPERAIAFVNELFGYFTHHELPAPSDFPVVVEWIGKGADPWRDILPVVHGVLEEISRKQYRPPQSWKYFGKSVFASLRKRHY